MHHVGNYCMDIYCGNCTAPFGSAPYSIRNFLTSPKGCAVTPYVGGYEDRVVSRAGALSSQYLPIALAVSSVVKQHRCETGWGDHEVCAVYN